MTEVILQLNTDKILVFMFLPVKQNKTKNNKAKQSYIK